MNIGVVGNPSYRDLQSVLVRLTETAPRLRLTLYAEPSLAHVWPGTPPAPRLLDAAPKLDFLITLGGDGTLLRAARSLNGAKTPILGINLGRVGFLTTATSQTIETALESLVRQSFVTESRLALLPTIVEREGKSRPEPMVLNDAVVHKGGVARVVRMRLVVDGEEVGQYSADGIIVATPTGSTAYSLSAGGPVVLPSVDAIIVTAICPHTLGIRPLVVPPSSTVSIEPVPPWTDQILVSFDGQVGTTMQPGERLLVRRAEHPVCLVRLGGEGFFARMGRKLQWGEPADREGK
ncbi:MAG TPA: NAD(+)/NADH kinase [Gemmatimonadales bacterium]|nr:NAD(+)/NADH kinase [Gemmatimonadales bacterium]